jgi:hypothetical protein
MVPGMLYKNRLGLLHAFLNVSPEKIPAGSSAEGDFFISGPHSKSLIPWPAGLLFGYVQHQLW